MSHAPSRAADGFHHPATEAQIIALIGLARRRRCGLRVRGSAHSIAPAIHTDAHLAGRPLAIDVMLDRYRKVAFDEARMQVVVEAGCHLGLDPRDPTRTSTWEGSLLAQLEARGWALPDLGGVTHQTVSGYLLTGSSGGSVAHAIEDAVIAIRFIDGRGDVHEVVRGQDELFDAVACSMGLLGVVSTIRLQCVPRYDVIGMESITTEGSAAYDAFGEGPGGLASFLRGAEYARLMWWPQRGVERITTWQARRMSDADYTAETGPRGALRPKPYQALGDGVSDPRLSRALSAGAQWLGGAFYDTVDAVSSAFTGAESRFPALSPVGRTGAALFEEHLLPAVLGEFVPLDAGRPQRFWGPWHDVLPMDNQMSEASLPTTFTEIWVPLDDAGSVMRRLRDHFRENGLAATGTYLVEIYAARATRAWLHPGHGRDSLRVDVFWFERNRQDPRRFFDQFWDLLAPYGYRLHWGKHLPDDAARGAEHLRRQYPRWDDFLRVRAELDPLGIFSNRHFREALGIGAPPASPHGEDEARRDIFVDTQISIGTGGALPARVQAFYEDLAVRREAALERLGEVFTDDIHYRDPFRETRGMAAFRVLFDRMFRQYREVGFTGFQHVGTDEAFTLTYDMHLRMVVGPDFVTPLASICTARGGKVAVLCDYFDFFTGLVSPVPPLAGAYRWFANTFFL